MAAAVRRHGAAGVAGAAVRRLLATLDRAADDLGERWFDHRRGIDTKGVCHAQVDGATTNYQAVHPKAFSDFLRFLPVDRKALTLVDYGSGKGRAVLLAVEHGFAGAVGVELVPANHAVALANLARHELRKGHRGRVRLVLGDARELPVPSGPIVAFLYHPFEREVMAGVLRNLVLSLRADPRPAWVIYENPVDRDLLDGNPMFEMLGERTERAGASPRRPRFAIYRTRPAE